MPLGKSADTPPAKLRIETDHLQKLKMSENEIKRAWERLFSHSKPTEQVLLWKGTESYPQRCTREQIYQNSIRFQDVLCNRLDVPKGSRIGILLDLDNYLPIVANGSWFHFCTIVLLDPDLAHDQLLAVINNAEIHTLVFSPKYMVSVSKLIKTSSTIENWILTETSSSASQESSIHVLSTLLEKSSATEIIEIDDSEHDCNPAAIAFTSDETNMARGVGFSFTGLLAAAKNISAELDKGKNFATFLSPNHFLSLIIGCLCPIFAKSKLAVISSEQIVNLAQIAADQKITRILTSRSVIRQITESVNKLPSNMHFDILLENPNSPELKELLTSIQTSKSLSYFFLEAGGLVTLGLPSNLSPQDPLPLGHPISGVLVRVIDSNFNDCNLDTEGQIVIESDQVMSGYAATRPGFSQLISETSIRGHHTGLLKKSGQATVSLCIAQENSTQSETDLSDAEDETCQHEVPTRTKVKELSKLSEIPPKFSVVSEIRKLTESTNINTNKLVSVCMSDPVVIIELIKLYQFASERNKDRPLVDLKDIVVLLGPGLINELCDQLLEREAFEHELADEYLENARRRCLHAGEVAHFITKTLRGVNPEEARLAAILREMSELQVIIQQPREYLELAESLPRVKLIYQLAKQYKFNAEDASVAYLKRMSCPPNLLQLIDSKMVLSAAERVKLKLICKAVAELIEMVAQETIDKVAPGKPLPARSTLKNLQVTDNEQKSIYEHILSVTTVAEEVLEEVKQVIEEQAAEETVVEPTPPETDTIESTLQENTSVDTLSSPMDNPEDLCEDEYEEECFDDSAITENIEGNLVDDNEVDQSLTYRLEPPIAAAPSCQLDDVITRTESILVETPDAMNALERVINVLTSYSAFTRAALLLVDSQDRSVEIMLDFNVNFGSKEFNLSNGWSAFLVKEPQVYSFSKRGRHLTEFKSLTYAMGPISVFENQSLMVYADCGPNEVIPFVARRLFRQLINMLKDKFGNVLEESLSPQDQPAGN